MCFPPNLLSVLLSVILLPLSSLSQIEQLQEKMRLLKDDSTSYMLATLRRVR